MLAATTSHAQDKMAMPDTATRPMHTEAERMAEPSTRPVFSPPLPEGLTQIPQLAPEDIFFRLGIGDGVEPRHPGRAKVDVVKTKSPPGVW